MFSKESPLAMVSLHSNKTLRQQPKEKDNLSIFEKDEEENKENEEEEEKEEGEEEENKEMESEEEEEEKKGCKNLLPPSQPYR